ncbi:MAG: hypothetical protein HGB21_08740, partial [Nitrospirae bacterium]|nr:hypothetical protein [Nitrospirota bacterium]
MQIMRAFGLLTVVLVAWTTAVADGQVAGGNPSFTITEAKVTKEKVEEIGRA